MSQYSLEGFLNDCSALCKEYTTNCDIVLEISPLMQKLILSGTEFLKPEHFQGNPAHYARNKVYCSDDNSLSLFTMVWGPGQWTPVHDHGTWGVVGIVKGSLEERSYIRMDDMVRPDSGIDLRRGGNVLLGRGSVTTFVPNPDHIHKTGVSVQNEQAVSLHLYGSAMNNYHIYDMELGRRKMIMLDDDTLCEEAPTSKA